MKRRLFNIVSALSLLMCVAVVLLGILSIWVQPSWGYCGEGGSPDLLVWSGNGCIALVYDTAYPFGVPLTGFHEFPVRSSFPWNRLGFDMQIGTGISGIPRGTQLVTLSISRAIFPAMPTSFAENPHHLPYHSNRPPQTIVNANPLPHSARSLYELGKDGMIGCQASRRG
jgi:hypothetical protein